MEDVTRHVIILMAHLNVLVLLDFCLQLITLTVMVKMYSYCLLSRFVKRIISDVDECQGSNGGCNQTCTNNDGSFECSCTTGYTLSVDNLGCDGD